MTRKLQVDAIFPIAWIKYRTTMGVIISHVHASKVFFARKFSRQEMILFILLSSMFFFNALKIVCVFIFQGKFYYVELAKRETTTKKPKKRTKEGKISTEKLIF